MPLHIRLSRLATVLAVGLCLAVVIPLAGIEISLLVSPAQNVDAAGQSLALSAGPSASTSGSGTLELFGQSIPTTQQFSGPIRPRLLWAEVTHYDELLLALKQPQHLGQDLRNGWSAYFTRELVIAVIAAVVLAALGLAPVPAALAVDRCWRRHRRCGRGWRRRGGNQQRRAGSAAPVPGEDPRPARRSRASCRRPHESQGADRRPRAPWSSATPPPRVRGILQLTKATPEDTACRRSRDSYAADIAAVNNSTVVNLACTNASIEAGLFGPEAINEALVPSQLARLECDARRQDGDRQHRRQRDALDTAHGAVPGRAAVRRQRFGGVVLPGAG